MNDRETVVKALEACGYTDGMIQCGKCPYDGIKCWTRLKKDLLELLKEREAVEPVRRGKWLPHPTEKDWRVCSACGQGTEIVRHEAGATTEYNYKHCPWCGARLEVEE